MSDRDKPYQSWKNAGLLAKTFHTWIFPLLRLGNKVDLDVCDLYECPEKYTSSHLCEKLEKQWNTELEMRQKGRKPSMLRAVLKAFKYELLSLLLVVFFQNCLFRICQSLLLKEIVDYYSKSENMVDKYEFFLLCMGLLWVSSFSYSFLANIGFSHGSFVGTRMRVACTQLMYKKIMRLGVENTNDTASGQIVNLIANNMNRFEIAARFCAYTVVAPMQLIISAFILWKVVGISTLAGSMAFALQFILQVIVGKITTRMRRKTAGLTDERVRLVNEIFTVIRVIKLYTWETPLFKQLKEIRLTEVTKKLLVSIVNGMTSDFAHAFGKIGVFFSMVAHFLYFGHPFNADKLFMTNSVFENLRLAGRMFAFAISYQADCISCLNRMEAIMLTEDREIKNYKHIEKPIGDIAISAKNATSLWSKTAEKPAIQNISIDIKRGELIAVIGPIGSGKTSFLMSLMGELVQNEGSLEVRGSIAYSPQEPWLINKTVRDNVLLFSSFNNERYAKALVATTLEKDILKMEFSDKTPVGEKGSSLSGGQKARVNLARALCADSDIYLLDDPLSAVDASVGRKIFDECIKEYLKDKTRVLVTHQVQFLKTVDRIIVLEKGLIVACGTFEELKNCVNLKSMIEKEKNKDKEPVETPIKSSLCRKESALTTEALECNFQTLVDHLEDDDDFETPKASTEMSRTSFMTVLRKYFSAAGGIPVILLLLFVGLTAQTLFNSIDMFLSFWCSYPVCWPEFQEFRLNGSSQSAQCPVYTPLLKNQNMYFYTYVAFVVGLALFWLLRSCLFLFFCNRASRYLHRKAIFSLFHAPVSFFDVNPMGRILNRITKDIGNIDDVLPFMFSEGFLITVMQLGYMVLIIYNLPVMTIGCVLLLAGCVIFGKFYIRPGRDLQRLDATTSSPVYSMMGSTLKGLPLIRTYKGEEHFMNSFSRVQNLQTSAAICNSCAGSFYRTGVEVCSMLFLAAINLTLIFSTDINAVVSGITLTSSTQMGLAIQYISLLVLQIITLMVSVERVLDYKKLPLDGDGDLGGKTPPASWPQKGHIELQRLHLRYRPDAEYSLKDLNITIPAGEKIGIVGRTGAGKSSIISAMMRLHEPEGDVIIDGVKTSEISLKVLRSRVSVIPQDPVIFTGTLRKSIDPFGRYPDFKIWESLRTVHMDSFVKEMPDGLSAHLTDGGSEFSQGQRQLICLARAVLLRNKILILDEASANLDFESDVLIQTAIRHNFRDCTVITVAHRLDTIIDYDRVLVLEQGKVMEYDEPHQLLQNPSGYFSNLVHETGSIKAASLRESAYLAHEVRCKREHQDDSYLDREQHLFMGNCQLQLGAL